MNCREFDLAWIDDDDALRTAAERHANECARCAEVVRADREILEHATAWKRSSPLPPADLERRIATGLAAEGWIEGGSARAAESTGGRRLVWFWVAAAAAVLIVGFAFFARPDRNSSEAESYASAVAQVEVAQRNYVEAIAELEQQAAQVLARSSDPGLSSQDAALLLIHRDRLAHLDSVIAEVQAFLDRNPGHARGHTVLLAAYVEKSELLRKIIEFKPGETS